jgi:peroxiredoxin
MGVVPGWDLCQNPGVRRPMMAQAKKGKIAAEWRKVKVDGHAEAVLEAASEL